MCPSAARRGHLVAAPPKDPRHPPPHRGGGGGGAGDGRGASTCPLCPPDQRQLAPLCPSPRSPDATVMGGRGSSGGSAPGTSRGGTGTGVAGTEMSPPSVGLTLLTPSFAESSSAIAGAAAKPRVSASPRPQTSPQTPKLCPCGGVGKPRSSREPTTPPHLGGGSVLESGTSGPGVGRTSSPLLLSWGRHPFPPSPHCPSCEQGCHIPAVPAGSLLVAGQRELGDGNGDLIPEKGGHGARL